MKTSRVLMLAVALMVGVGFVAVAQTATPAAPMLGQPGSLIEVYGVIDGALRFATNASVAPFNYSELYLSQGLFNGSRVGFRGTEGLGGGFKAIYDLETGVVLPTGQLDQQGQIFGRQAWVGVDSADYGRLTFGRVYGTFSDAIGAGDVFGTGHGNQPYWSNSAAGSNNYASNDAVNAFFLQESGLRWDNSIKYEANFYGVTLGGQVSLGDIPNSIGATGFLPENTMYAASIGYNSKNFPVSGALGYQTEVDTAFRSHSDYGFGAKYAFDATDAVYVFGFYSVFDNFFARLTQNNSEMSSGLGYQRTDYILNVAVNYYVMPNLNVIASFYYDYAQNILGSGDWGDRISGLLVADYYFTKNFDAYLGASYSGFDGNLQQTSNGGPQYATTTNVLTYVFSAMTGVRFRF